MCETEDKYAGTNAPYLICNNLEIEKNDNLIEVSFG